jgi:hypothetical protein
MTITENNRTLGGPAAELFTNKKKLFENSLHALSSKFHSGRQYKNEEIEVQLPCEKSTKNRTKYTPT